MDILSLVAWFQSHAQELLLIVTSLVTVASLIVKWTPTLKDDNVWLPFVKWLSKYVALNRTVDDEEVRDE